MLWHKVTRIKRGLYDAEIIQENFQISDIFYAWTNALEKEDLCWMLSAVIVKQFENAIVYIEVWKNK
jgi:hypothetical protein